MIHFHKYYKMKSKIFITGAGRCGSVTISTLLAKSKNALVMHEGVVEPPMNSQLHYIPPLFPENLEAYFSPDKATDIIKARRFYIIEGCFSACPVFSPS
jgi:hypothetical protein